MRKTLLSSLFIFILPIIVHASPFYSICNWFIKKLSLHPPIISYSKNYLLLKDVDIGDTVLIKTKNNNDSGVIKNGLLDKIQIQTPSGQLREYKIDVIDQLEIITKNKDPNLENFFYSKKEFLKQKYFEKATWDYIKSHHLSRILALQPHNAEKLLEESSEDLLRVLAKKFNSQRFGFHFNLHGGGELDYHKTGGIKVGISDPAAIHGIMDRGFDPTPKVFFFDSFHKQPHEILGFPHPQTLGSGRMGDLLIIFDLNHEFFKKAINENGIKSRTNISIAFNPEWLKNNLHLNKNKGEIALTGIPADSFLSFPIHLFRHTNLLLGTKNLSRDQVTYANILFLTELFKRITN